MVDRRDERRRRARELRDGGASLREIAETLGISPATAMRDCRAAGSAGSSSVAPEHGETAYHGAGIGETTDAVDMSDYQSVEREYTRVYAALASGERVPASQVKLLATRHAQLLKEEATCAEHMTLQTYLEELRWRDTVWQDALTAAFWKLQQAGCADAEDTLNGALQRVSEITKAGRQS